MHYILHRFSVQKCKFHIVISKKFLSTIDKQLFNNTSVITQVHNCFQPNYVEYFMNYLPRKLIRRSKVKRPILYLVNPDIAKTFSCMICDDLQKNTSFVIECNPGLGLLTKELLKAGIASIHLYEKDEQFLKPDSPLSTLLLNYKTHLHLKQLNFIDAWLLLLHDKFYKNSLADVYLENAPYHNWKHNTFAQIIYICSDRTFLTLLIHNFVNQTNIFDHGRPTFYMGLPSSIWKHFVATNASDENNIRYYNQYNVMLHLFFEFHLLGELPRKAFLPWFHTKSGIQNNDTISIVKLEPKINAYNLIKKNDLKIFWFFLKHCMRSKNNKVITEFEKFSSGCGPKLIQQNIDICTSFKELNPKKLLILFKRLKTWPSYDESIFTPSSEFTDEIKKEEDKLEIEEEQEDLTTQLKT